MFKQEFPTNQTDAAPRGFELLEASACHAYFSWSKQSWERALPHTTNQKARQCATPPSYQEETHSLPKLVLLLHFGKPVTSHTRSFASIMTYSIIGDTHNNQYKNGNPILLFLECKGYE